jgi:hypothetical protein
LGRILIVRSFVSLFDAGASSDPLVAGVDYLFQIGIRENTFRIRVTDPYDPGVL